MNNTLKYLNTASLLSTSIKEGVKVVIMSGLQEHEFNLEIVKNDPFIQHSLNAKDKAPVETKDQMEVCRDNMLQASWTTSSAK